VLCLSVWSLSAPSIGFAQNLTNPSAVDFDASPSHSTVTSSTPPVALVSSYLIEIYASTGALVKATDVGKPAPVSGKITVDLGPIKQTLPLGTGYTIKAVAKGPGGEGRSAASAPFDLTVPAPAAPGVPIPK
jgi:hypothetical protein